MSEKSTETEMTYKGKVYEVTPEQLEGECTGCAFHKVGSGCTYGDSSSPCMHSEGVILREKGSDPSLKLSSESLVDVFWMVQRKPGLQSPEPTPAPIYWARVTAISKVEGLEGYLSYLKYTDLQRYVASFGPTGFNKSDLERTTIAHSPELAIGYLRDVLKKSLRADLREYLEVKVKIVPIPPGQVFYETPFLSTNGSFVESITFKE